MLMASTEGTRACKSCKIEKPITSFKKCNGQVSVKTGQPYRKWECRKCGRDRNPRKHRAYNERARRKRGGVSKADYIVALRQQASDAREGALWFDRLARMAYSARARAKKKGLPYDLDVKWIRENSKRTRCPITGRGFVFTPEGPHGGTHPDYPSIDRIDPAKGYTKGNVRVISYWANIALNTLTDGQFIMMCRAAVQKHDN